MSYLIAAYGAIGVVLIVYSFTLLLRLRRVERMLAKLRQ